MPWMVTRMMAAVVFVAVAAMSTAHGSGASEPIPSAQSELAAIKAQLALLQARLAQLESAQKSQAEKAATTVADQVAVNTGLQGSIDRTADQLARTVGEGASSGWLGRWVWKGDLRVRNDHIDQEATISPRNRNRMRLRVGASARVNPSTRVEFQFTTAEGADARAPMQSFSDANSRKPLEIDTAFVEWSPNERWRISAGKMRYPWVRTASFFFDNDINPEGVGAQWQQAANGLFGSMFYTQLSERPTAADSGMMGAQIGWRWNRSDGSRILIAGAYYDHIAVRGYNPFQSASVSSAGLGSFGNSTSTSTAVCRKAIAVGTACLANDYNIFEVLGEYQFNVGQQPLLLFANVAQNTAADYSITTTSTATTIPKGLDTAYAAGITYGRTSATTPGTWEVGYLYQIIEKDALFGQWIDSDFAAGNTDGGGSVIRGAYQVSPNWRLNLAYLISDTNRDVAVGVTTPSVRNLFNRQYKRLHVDLNWSF